MRLVIKYLCVAIFIFAAAFAGNVWLHDDKSDFPWPLHQFFKYGGPVLSVVALGVLVKLHYRRDDVPDYLVSRMKWYFNRDGFCFHVRPTVVDGICILKVYFQNQYENPCVGRVALRPALGFFLGRAKMSWIIIEIDCASAAFGVAKVAIPVPAKLQGTLQRFDIGASVEYPERKGRRLRFRDGTTIYANADFGDAFAVGLKVAGALMGNIVYTSPAKVDLLLPDHVAEDVSDVDAAVTVEILWALGDPPLSDNSARLG